MDRSTKENIRQVCEAISAKRLLQAPGWIGHVQGCPLLRRQWQLSLSRFCWSRLATGLSFPTLSALAPLFTHSFHNSRLWFHARARHWETMVSSPQPVPRAFLTHRPAVTGDNGKEVPGSSDSLFLSSGVRSLSLPPLSISGYSNLSRVSLCLPVCLSTDQIWNEDI